MVSVSVVEKSLYLWQNRRAAYFYKQVQAGSSKAGFPTLWALASILYGWCMDLSLPALV